jgi:tRNA nucleotidyltransferase (CCA-adding enzyme)
LTDDPQIRFAALMHDLGKGTTPERDWPAHHGHEARGAKLIEKLCTRYKIPNAYRELAVIVARYHLDSHRILEMKKETILKKLEALDAIRRPERFEKFLTACEADARGRAGFEDRDYSQADYFRQALKLANSVNTSVLAEQGLTGENMGRSIKQQRLSALESLWDNSE